MIKKYATLALKLTISAGLIWFLFKDMDLSAVKGRLLSAYAPLMALACVVTAAQIFISVLRWRSVIHAIQAQMPLSTSIRLYLIGLFFNQFLPSSVGGDAVRIYKSYRMGLSVPDAIHSVALERAGIVFSLVVLVNVLLPFLTSAQESQHLQWLSSVCQIALVVSCVGLVVLASLDKIKLGWETFSPVRSLMGFAQSTRQTFFAPRYGIELMVLCLLTHFTISLAAYYLARSLEIEVTVIECVTLIPLVMLLTTLPISIAGWGVRETAMVFAFGAVGVNAEDALVLSIAFGLLAVLFAIPGGVVWLISHDKKIEAVPLVLEGGADYPRP